MRKSIYLMSFMFLAAVALIAGNANGQRNKPVKTMVKGHAMYKVLEPGYIPAIFEPEFISIEQAEKQYYPEEPLIAVVVEDQIRGYSTWHLDQHEVVNDVINGHPITVTW